MHERTQNPYSAYNIDLLPDKQKTRVRLPASLPASLPAGETGRFDQAYTSQGNTPIRH